MKRLFPCWIMVSESPFPKHEGSLLEALDGAQETKRFTDVARFFTWHLPVNTVSRYVRIQIEKLNSLHLAEVEVYGRMSPCTPPVFSVECGRDATAVVCRPRSSETMEKAYLKACQADRHNALLLRQIPAFQDYFDTFQTGRAIGEENEMCRMCTSARDCDRCDTFKRYKILHNCELEFKSTYNRLPNLNEIAKMLLKEEPINRVAEPPLQRTLRNCFSCVNDASKYLKTKTKEIIEGKMDDNQKLREHIIRGV